MCLKVVFDFHGLMVFLPPLKITISEFPRWWFWLLCRLDDAKGYQPAWSFRTIIGNPVN